MNLSRQLFWAEQAQVCIAAQQLKEKEYASMKLDLEEGKVLKTDQAVVELEQYMHGAIYLTALMRSKGKVSYTQGFRQFRLC